jgi:hypothetical protein
MKDRIEEIREYLKVHGNGAISVRGNHEQEDLIALIEQVVDEAYERGVTDKGYPYPCNDLVKKAKKEAKFELIEELEHALKIFGDTLDHDTVIILSVVISFIQSLKSKVEKE